MASHAERVDQVQTKTNITDETLGTCPSVLSWGQESPSATSTMHASAERYSGAWNSLRTAALKAHVRGFAQKICMVERRRRSAVVN